ncbi:MAG: FAD-dependent thymidylate synthase, partial [Actinomycetota bacterium]|nr:FAD-dependent thymidylate synthase [Actinomycetota bacterium]
METSERDAGRIAGLFQELGGTVAGGFPAIHSATHHTKTGIPYLKRPGVVMLARPQTNVAGLKGFLEGFDPSLGFPAYLDDPTWLPDSSQLCKTAGQLCYASFGPRRTTNENAAAYFERLTSAGHGSVLEHASFSFLLYGISRSVTHELVRH